MTKPRKKIGLKTKLAATLCQMVKLNFASKSTEHNKGNQRHD